MIVEKRGDRRRLGPSFRNSGPPLRVFFLVGGFSPPRLLTSPGSILFYKNLLGKKGVKIPPPTPFCGKKCSPGCRFKNPPIGPKELRGHHIPPIRAPRNGSLGELAQYIRGLINNPQQAQLVFGKPGRGRVLKKIVSPPGHISRELPRNTPS